MSITSYVQFIARDTWGYYAPETEFKDINSLRAYIKEKYNLYPLSLRLIVTRYICTQDTDKPKQKPTKTLKGFFECFVYDYVLTPRDMKNVLQTYEKWPNLQIENIQDIKLDTPVLYHQKASYPLSKKGKRELSDILTMRQLTNKDLIINTDLIQIWPRNENYGKTPHALEYLLNKQHVNED